MTIKYQKRHATLFIAIHCADTLPEMDIGVKEIRKWHQAPPRNWTDVGYQYVIRRDGTVEEGRPEWAIGAHVEGYNARSLGICLAGGKDHDKANPDNTRGVPANNFTPEQMTSLLKLVKEKKQKYASATVQGHTDFPNVGKACPCFDVKAWWAADKDKPDV